MTSPASLDNTLRLPDGRQLGYAEYGSPSGAPVLFFHGAPGSRRSIFADMAEVATQRGVRLIAPERPGYGLSDTSSARTMLDWTGDIAVLTHALGINRYKLIGFSMGSLYALACAHAAPEQVARVAIVGGLAPFSVAGVTEGMAPSGQSLYELARADPDGLRTALAPLADAPAGLITAMATTMPAADQAVLAARAPAFEADVATALRCGVEGFASDFVLASGEWSFPLTEISASVDLWIGSEDRNMPPAMTRHLASVLPHSQMIELPGAGHVCLYTHWNEILDRLTRRSLTGNVRGMYHSPRSLALS